MAIIRKSKPTGAVPEQGRRDYFATLPSIRHGRGAPPEPAPLHGFGHGRITHMMTIPGVADVLTPYGVWHHSAGAPHRRRGKALQSHGNGPASEVAWRVNILLFNAMFILW